MRRPSSLRSTLEPPPDAIHLVGEKGGEYWLWWNSDANALCSVTHGVVDMHLTKRLVDANISLMDSRPEKKIDWIIDVMGQKKIDAVGRKYVMKGYTHPKVGFTAFIGAPLLMKAVVDMATLFVGRDPNKRYEFFEHEDAAVAWLKKMKEERIKRRD